MLSGSLEPMRTKNCRLRYGLERCAARTLDHDHDYASDTGPMTALVVCTTGAAHLERPLALTWTIDYR